MSTAEDAHVREFLRACDCLLAQVEADPAVAVGTRMAAGAVAAALRHVALDWPQVVREWYERRSTEQQLREWMADVDARLSELQRLVSEQEAGAPLV
jgi:hypothetical protein